MELRAQIRKFRKFLTEIYLALDYFKDKNTEMLKKIVLETASHGQFSFIFDLFVLETPPRRHFFLHSQKLVFETTSLVRTLPLNNENRNITQLLLFTFI